jgi:hypothetical protein
MAAVLAIAPRPAAEALFEHMFTDNVDVGQKLLALECFAAAAAELSGEPHLQPLLPPGMITPINSAFVPDLTHQVSNSPGLDRVSTLVSSTSHLSSSKECEDTGVGAALSTLARLSTQLHQDNFVQERQRQSTDPALSGPGTDAKGKPAEKLPAQRGRLLAGKYNPEKTRIWGHATLQKLQQGPEPAASRNRFAEVALHWASGLLNGAMAKGRGPTIFRSEDAVLGKFVGTLGIFCRCARLSEAATPLCTAVLELILVCACSLLLSGCLFPCFAISLGDNGQGTVAQ